MHRAVVFLASAVLVIAVGLISSPRTSADGPVKVCGPADPDAARCHAQLEPGRLGDLAQSAPYGLSPAQIKSAYGFSTSSTAGAGKTIAIVDAYDDPTAESDLAVFNAQYGLPACTTANGCFKKVDQTGGTRYPRTDGGWALEISLDVQWAHAIAPGAKILLVEAKTNSFANLLAAEDYAKTHAQYVSNSWGGSESAGEAANDLHFVQSGVSFFVSSGDAGLPAEYPSSSPNVISVGGTTLTFDGSGNLVSETGWSSGGGGCSAFELATSAQLLFAEYGQAGCAGTRATPDVSLDADPASGVSVYDSTRYQGQKGWWKVGGTSASSPMWAARSADAGVTVDAGYVYGNNITFRDITSGNNGAPCLTGFDLCSGRGSWTGNAP
jgi:subtilase family serine protease